VIDLMSRYIPGIAICFESLVALVSISEEAMLASMSNILSVIMSTRDVDIFDTPEFYVMWRHVYELMIHLSGESLLIAFLSELAPDIRASLFEMLPLVRDDDGSYRGLGTGLWHLVARSDPAGFCEFLRDQPPSVNLCYAIANVTIGLFDARYLPIVEELMGARDGADAEYTAALVVALSAAIRSEEGSLFGAFIEFALEGITANSDDRVKKAAVSAFWSASTRDSGHFQDEAGYVEALCENSENYARLLDESDCCRMFGACASLISRPGNESTAAGLISMLRVPVNQVLVCEGLTVEDVFKVCGIIREVCYRCDSFAPIFSDGLFEPMLGLTRRALIEGNSEVLEVALGAVAAVIVTRPAFDESRFNAACELLSSCPEPHGCILRFFGVVRAAFCEVESFLDGIATRFVVPVIEMEELLGDLCWMLREFKCSLVLDGAIDVCLRGIRSVNADANALALEYLGRLLVQVPSETWLQAVGVCIRVVLEALVDAMHNSAIRSLIGFLICMAGVASRLHVLHEQFVPMVVGHLGELLPNAGRELICQFGHAIVTWCSNESSFVAVVPAVVDFLVLAKTLAPYEEEVFLGSRGNRHGRVGLLSRDMCEGRMCIPMMESKPLMIRKRVASPGPSVSLSLRGAGDPFM
jgi:hypothetical protein